MGERAIRVGVVGLGRGLTYASGAEAAGMELVALCDTWQERLDQVGTALGVTTYTDYDAFLSHDMDAVVLANYFHQHAPFAIKALRAGFHVLSETSACKTLAEGVALIREVERSGKIYMLAENLSYMAFNQEMRRLYQAGEVGRFIYGESEYVHPFGPAEWNAIAPAVDHWRNWIPLLYYCTHAVGPVMYITDTWPVQVNGFVVPYDHEDPAMTMTPRRGDPVGTLMLKMDNGAIVKATQGTMRGGSLWVRIHGNRGAMENLRTEGDKLLVSKSHWEVEAGEDASRTYRPEFPHHAVAAGRAGHGGADFFSNFEFAQAVRKGEQPFLDVYRGVAMSIVGILGWRSALNDSASVAVPDLRIESERSAYEQDHWSPDPADRGPGQPSSSVLGDIEPSEEALAAAHAVWEKARILYADQFDAMLKRATKR